MREKYAGRYGKVLKESSFYFDGSTGGPIIASRYGAMELPDLDHNDFALL